jgi:hypothetical protein
MSDSMEQKGADVRTKGVKVTAEGFRQLIAAFDNPEKSSFTQDAFEAVLDWTPTNLRQVLSATTPTQGMSLFNLDLSDTIPPTVLSSLAASRSKYSVTTAVPPVNGVSPAPGVGAESNNAVPVAENIDKDADMPDTEPTIPVVKKRRAPPVAKSLRGPGGEILDRTANLLQDAPTAKLDITILGDIPITLQEICAVSYLNEPFTANVLTKKQFFPAHYGWHAFALRFEEAGWSPMNISRLIVRSSWLSSIHWLSTDLPLALVPR